MSVFPGEYHTLVYRMKGDDPQEQEVTLGKRNSNYVVVEEGLGIGDRVALRDPTLKLETIGGVEAKGGDARPNQPSANGG